MLMLDLCAGLGGASQAMKERGWKVITVDVEPMLQPDIVADVRSWSWHGARPDLIWASTTCTEFSREFMPWSRTGQPPDMSIVNACKRIIAECNPRFWVLENVKGAARFLGSPAAIVGPFYLWGVFPPLGRVGVTWRRKESYSSTRPEERARIPYPLSLSVALAVERAIELPLPAV